MAYKNEITRWLLNNKHLMGLSFTQYDWPSKYLKNVYDFSAQIDFNGIQSEGRGIDLNPELALEKASAEVIERYICQKLEISSVGVAVSGANSSLDHARFEALERYYLNKHLKQKIPMYFISETLFTEFRIANHLKDFKHQNQLNDFINKTDVSFFRMQTPSNLFRIVCLIKSLGDSKNSCGKIYSYGFSLSKQLDKSLEKSFLEALPSYISLTENKYKKNLIKPWHLTSNFSEKINSLLFENDDHNSHSKIIHPSLDILKINWDQFPELKDCPIDPIRVNCATTDYEEDDL